MPSLTDINFYASYGRILAQKIPNSNRYYVFYTKSNTGQVNSPWTLLYAIVDLSLNNGNGDVTAYDQVVDGSLSAGYTLAQGDNTDDAWLVTHRAATDSFFAYKITNAGLSNTPVKSRAGTNTNAIDYIFRELKTSHDGKMIAGVAYRDYSVDFASTRQFIEVFNFNAGDGRITNKVRTERIGNYFYTYQSVEFSPDNRLLYGGFVQRVDGLQPCGFGSGAVIQYNLCYSDSTEFTRYAMTIASDFAWCYPWVSWGKIQMGADKRIHMPYTGLQISTINKPNRIGSHANYVFNSYVQTVPNNGFVVTPGFQHKQLEKAIKNNIVYNGACYPSPTIFRVTNDTITNIAWNFGDPASGTNTSAIMAPSHTFSSPGLYSVTARLYNTQNKLIETLTELVEIKDPGKRLLSGYPKDTSFCMGKNLNIRLNVVNGIYHWYQVTAQGEIYNSTIADSIAIGSTGTWYVEMRQNDCNGCRMLDSINVTVLPKPDFNLGIDRTLCKGDSIQLSVYDPAANYTWNTGETSLSVWVRQGGTYWVEGEYNNNGCAKRDSIVITQVPAVNFSLPLDTTLCNNQTLLLNPAVTGATYVWQDGSVQPSYNVTETGTYWVKVTSINSCTRNDTILVNYINAQQVYLGNDSTLCLGNSITLRSDVPGAGYFWSTGSTANQIKVNQTGNYWIRVNNGSCTVTDTIRLVFSPPPKLFLGNDTILCAQDKLQLQPGISNAVYSWQNGSDANTFTVTQPGTYWLQIAQNGCIVRDSINIDYYIVPVLNIGPDIKFCTGENEVLNPTDGFIQYKWNTGAVTQKITVNNPGNYSVIGTTTKGCKAYDTIQVLSPFGLPVVNLDHDPTLCTGDTRILDAGNNLVSYLWNDGSTVQTKQVKGTGLYAVMVTDNNGCKNTDTVVVTTLLPLPVDFLPADMEICSYQTLDLASLQAYSQYLWNTNATTRSISISQPGLYSLQVIDQNNCKGKDSIVINLKDCMLGLFVPSAFSPNNDGKNDLFRPLLFGPVRQYRFTIFNRWGQTLFQSTEINKGWDGNYAGVKQDTNVFIWVCSYQLEGEQPKVKKGTVLLLR